MSPPRPSRNLDRALLAAGRELLPHRGCAGLTVREVTEAAGVNLGMFHYHFKSRESFMRAVLQSMYDEMFTQLMQRAVPLPDAGESPGAIELLRVSLRFMGRFVRANRPLLVRVLADAMCGDPIASEFLGKNMPRHLGVMHSLVEAGRKDGSLKDLPTPQLLGFCAGSLAMPILFGGAVVDSRALPDAQSKALADALLTDEALDQRIELALAAVANTDHNTRAARQDTAKRRASKKRGRS